MREGSKAGEGPLAGKRILVTRQAAKSAGLSAAIAELGGLALALPTIGIDTTGPFPAFEAAIRDISNYDFIVVTSANAASALASALAARTELLGVARLPRVVAIGPGTAAALASADIQTAAMPDEAVSEGLASCMGAVKGMRILIPGSDLARGVIGRELRLLGAAVEEVVSYRTVAAELDPAALEELERGVDALLFTSPSTARNLVEALGGIGKLGDTLVACIGPVTAEAARELGLAVDLVAKEHTMEGLVASLVEYWRLAGKRSAKE